jgi:hypothetical protein
VVIGPALAVMHSNIAPHSYGTQNSRDGNADCPPIRDTAPGSIAVEFLNLVLIFATAFLVLRRPDRERLAFRLLVISTVLMVFLFSMATRTGLLPGVNY